MYDISKYQGQQIALIDDEKGVICDIKKRTVVRMVKRWNGVCTQNGKYGLYAPNRYVMTIQTEGKYGKQFKKYGVILSTLTV